MCYPKQTTEIQTLTMGGLSYGFVRLSLFINMFRFFKGKRTYIVAGCMAVFAAVGGLTGWISKEEAIMLLLNAAGMAGLRDAINR